MTKIIQFPTKNKNKIEQSFDPTTDSVDGFIEHIDSNEKLETQLHEIAEHFIENIIEEMLELGFYFEGNKKLLSNMTILSILLKAIIHEEYELNHSCSMLLKQLRQFYLLEDEDENEED